jgi:UPF0042 nucleotide-binding protein
MTVPVPPTVPPPPPPAPALDVRIVTGLSGSGKSTALRVFEDLGFFSVDNLPALLLGDLIRICSERDDVRRVALGMDVREKGFLAAFAEAVENLRRGGHVVEILFLDASDEALLRRFSSTRRPHPLSPDGDVLTGVRREREALAAVRAGAGRILDTSDLNVHDLRRRVIDHLAAPAGAAARPVLRFVSFGYKYGLPIDADLVFDVRFLPNPFFIDRLRDLPGFDPAVAAFVTGHDEARWFLDAVLGLLERLLPQYAREGRTYLTVAVGCTGGRHRSVAIAEALASRLSPHADEVRHRDVHRESVSRGDGP